MRGNLQKRQALDWQAGDSLRFSNGKWCWFSRGSGGYSALDYLIKVNGYSFLEAMETISGRAAIPPPSFVPVPKEEKPKHGIDWRRHNLLSLAGVYQPKKKMEESKLPVALTRFLEDHPHVKTIYLHLDNDTAGRFCSFDRFSLLQIVIIYVNIKAVR